MKNGLFSSLTPEERFLLKLTILIATGVILVFAIFIGVLVQQRIQPSDNDNISKQNSSPVTELSDDTNNLNLETTWNVESNASTNVLTPLTAPIIFNTNSN
jgi:hypothetical protein